MKIDSLNIFSSLLLVIIIGSCNLFNLDYYDEQLKLSRTKKNLGDSIWVGFPEKVDSNVRVITSYNPIVLKHNLNYYGIFIREVASPKYFTNKINTLLSQKVFQGNVGQVIENDSVFFFNIKGTSDAHFKDEISYIIPEFSSEHSPVKNLVSKSSNIIILKSEFGDFNNNEYLEYSKVLDENGLSKGVYYNEDNYEIIYWLIMW